MSVQQNEWAKGSRPVPYPSEAGVVVALRTSFTVPATGLGPGDIIEMAPLPPHCRLVDLVFDSDDLDTGGAPAIVWDVGLMSGEWGSTDQARTCGDEFLDGTTVSQAGGVARPTLAKALRTGTAAVARSIGAKLVTAPSTGAAGQIGLTVLYATG